MDHSFKFYGLLLALASLVWTSIASSSSTTIAPPAEKPFFESDMFKGLAIGLGAILGGLCFCCIAWKLLCGESKRKVKSAQ